MRTREIQKLVKGVENSVNSLNFAITVLSNYAKVLKEKADELVKTSQKAKKPTVAKNAKVVKKSASKKVAKKPTTKKNSVVEKIAKKQKATKKVK